MDCDSRILLFISEMAEQKAAPQLNLSATNMFNAVECRRIRESKLIFEERVNVPSKKKDTQQ